MIKALSLFFILLLTLGGCATKQNSLNSGSAGASSSDMQARMVAYVNSIRQKGAVCAPPAPALAYNSSLERAAQAHAKDMALNNKLSHTGSGTATDPAKSAIGVGSSHVERILYFGYPNKVGNLLGENITYTKFSKSGTEDYFTNFKAAISTIMHDRAHCEIVMNPRFTDIGMGMYKTDDRFYFAMDLGERTKEVQRVNFPQ